MFDEAKVWEIMAYRGHVKNGKVILDESANLPEGAEVSVSLLNQDKFHPDIAGFTGIIPENIDIKEEYIRAILRKHQ